MASRAALSFRIFLCGLFLAVVGFVTWRFLVPASPAAPLQYQPRQPLNYAGLNMFLADLKPWPADASLRDVSNTWRQTSQARLQFLEQLQREGKVTPVYGSLLQAIQYNFDGDSEKAYQILEQARTTLEKNPDLAEEYLYSVLFYQGVTALRLGENENCIFCRGESSCILPIVPAAVHTHPRGSRLARQHFGDYLKEFPDDLEVRWLLNLAQMTLGEHPSKVDRRFLLSLDRFTHSEFDIGRFRDIGALVGVNRMNQSGGAIMEDFDNDGLLDLAVTSWDPSQPMALYRNRGDGTFEERTRAAGLGDQLGGLYCVQVDYNNDDFMDIFICRGAWIGVPIRPSLLRNNGNGTFTDVTHQAGLATPVNSISASWADYDNDGLLDLFVCCEKQPNRLYHNKGDGTFEEVAVRAGVQGNGQVCKGAAWIDFDNDGYPDLFLNNLAGTAQLFRNNRNGTFSDVTLRMGIDGPRQGFSCWAWDFDNDGWLDIFATSYDRSLEDVVKGIVGQPHQRHSNKLYRNLQGKGFQDVTREAGLDMVFAAMGSNFADFDNDGYLDFYLGTGDPNLHMLVPNRMFKNVAGKRFAEISGSSGTGHLQKGHGVACGDWDRDGNVDLFIEMGGALNSDKYHNILFQNPGQGNSWLTVKLIGKKTNRAAIGARIKVVTSAEKPLTIHRHISSGSSFGANPLQQTIGLARAPRINSLEIFWPTSKTTQVFRNVAVNQAIEITEFAKDYRKLDWKPIPVPK